METVEINRKAQQEKGHVAPTEETSSRTAAGGASTAQTTTTQTSGSLGERKTDAQKSTSKYLSDKRAAKNLANKKRKKMAHRRTLRASHTKG
ncbi:MAG TPA: hypothetical protein VJT08_08100 [Terriglobales bacterium]|nr:hypothetical protein [Terriglobales bacterium]